MRPAAGPPGDGTGRQVAAIAAELASAGVRGVVICPGSRSTPLALAVEAEAGLRTWVHLDERAGAFFALGAARAARAPVAILTTSGSAAANVLPAVVEADRSRVPLLVLTADRPPELRDRGANQVIDQIHLFGRAVRWFAEVPAPAASVDDEAHRRGVIGRAVAMTLDAPAGPVHLDLPFREPLVPGDGLDAGGATGPAVSRLRGRRRLEAADLAALADRLAGARRPLIVVGPIDVPDLTPGVARLAGAVAAPIVADALSGLRLGPHDRSRVLACPDMLVRAPIVTAELAPDVVLRIGATPTSKALGAFLAGLDAIQLVVDDGGWTEATRRPVTMIDADPVRLVEDLADAIAGSAAEDRWLRRWRSLDAAAAAAIETAIAAIDEPFEGAIPAALAALAPEGTTVVAGNSMPVRDLDAFVGVAATGVRLLGDRGTSGIDGTVSTALGVAAMSDGPVLAIVGDLAFIHDLNALVGPRDPLPDLTVVLVDNDGGGIFSFLPQASAARPDVGLPAAYERLFGTPHGVDLGAFVRAAGVEHRRLEPGSLGPALAASLRAPGIRVLELRTDRARNVELHRSIEVAALAAIAGAGASPA